MEGSEHLHTEVEIESLSKESRGPGLRLRQARERCRLSVASIADTLHLEQRVIEALEADDYDQLPPVTYVRGYLSAYARLVNLPAASVLQAFERMGPQERSRPLTSNVGRVGGRHAGARRVARFSMSASGLLTLAFAAVLISGWMFWTERRSAPEPPLLNEPERSAGESRPAPAAEADGERAAVAPNSQTTRAAAEVSQTRVATAAASAPPSAPEQWRVRGLNDTDGETAGQAALAPAPPRTGDGGVSTEAAESVDQKPDNGTAAAEPLASEAASPSQRAALETLKVEASGESWVDVEDAGGQRLVYGLLNRGESRRITGRPPFAITIGDATQVRLRHNGSRVDLGPYTHDKVARFTLTGTRD